MKTTSRKHSASTGVAAQPPGSDPVDMTDDPEYQAWVESMAQHCRCSHDCPCDGVLAGGLCDDIQDRERESIFDDEDEI